MGKDARSPLDVAVEYLEEKGVNKIFDRTVVPYYYASQVAAYIGDFEKAFTFADTASRNNFWDSWPVRDMAPFVAKAGGDPTPLLETAKERVQIEKHKNHVPSLTVRSLLAMGEVLRGLGRRDYISWIREAEEFAEPLTGKDSFAFSELSNTYAKMGRFPQAFAAVKRIDMSNEKNTIRERQRALAQIAYRLYESGQVDRAFTTARDANLSRTTINLLFKEGERLVQAGENPVGVLTEALKITDTLDDSSTVLPVSDLQGTLYSRAGRMLTVAGEDPTKYFDTARDLAYLSGSWKGTDVFQQLAQDVHFSGGDGLSVLEEGLDIAKDPLNLDDIHEGALKCGYFDFADDISSKLSLQRSKYEETDRLYPNWSYVIDGWEIHFKLDKARALTRSTST